MGPCWLSHRPRATFCLSFTGGKSAVHFYSPTLNAGVTGAAAGRARLSPGAVIGALVQRLQGHGVHEMVVLSDAAVATVAYVVLTTDQIGRLADAIAIGRRTLAIAKQGIGWRWVRAARSFRSPPSVASSQR